MMKKIGGGLDEIAARRKIENARALGKDAAEIEAVCARRVASSRKRARGA
jgi:hypothetical protein